MLNGNTESDTIVMPRTDISRLEASAHAPSARRPRTATLEPLHAHAFLDAMLRKICSNAMANLLRHVLHHANAL